METGEPIRGFRLRLHPRLSHVVHLRSTASKRLLAIANSESRIPNAYCSVNSIVALGESYPVPLSDSCNWCHSWFLFSFLVPKCRRKEPLQDSLQICMNSRGAWC